MLCNIQYTLGINQIPVSTKWQCCQGWWSLFFEAELPGVVLKPFHSRQVLVWHSQKTEITWPSWSPISWWILKKDSQCCSLPTHCLPLIHVLLTGRLPCVAAPAHSTHELWLLLSKSLLFSCTDTSGCVWEGTLGLQQEQGTYLQLSCFFIPTEAWCCNTV